MVEVEPGVSAIEISGLFKTYGSELVLKDLNLTVAWGEFLTIFGPNGSGKTTLLKVLSTLSRPTRGEIRIAGFHLKVNPVAIRRNIGMVTHQPLLYSHLTTFENLKFYGKMFGVARLEERIVTAADMMGIGPVLGRYAGALSHGMQKRVSLARAIIHDPPILLLDEPETGLDQDALEMLKDLVVGERGRRTVVMATHNLDRGLALSNRVAILAGGKIAYAETRDMVDEEMFKGTYRKLTGIAT